MTCEMKRASQTEASFGVGRICLKDGGEPTGRIVEITCGECALGGSEVGIGRHGGSMKGDCAVGGERCHVDAKKHRRLKPMLLGLPQRGKIRRGSFAGGYGGSR